MEMTEPADDIPQNHQLIGDALWNLRKALYEAFEVFKLYGGRPVTDDGRHRSDAAQRAEGLERINETLAGKQLHNFTGPQLRFLATVLTFWREVVDPLPEDIRPLGRPGD
jgi:hypothetical protein